MARSRVATALCLLAVASSAASGRALRAQPARPDLGFGPDWTERWTETRLAGRANRFSVVEEAGEPVLRVESDRSASALWHRLTATSEDAAIVSWSWKVEGVIPENPYERARSGDDFAARFFVIFDGEPFSPSARALCYVWASRESLGASFRNPYFDNVQTIVLESGEARAGTWVGEERDFLEDYRRAFGDSPSSVRAIAVMVDTDNTESRATAWFGRIRLRKSD